MLITPTVEGEVYLEWKANHHNVSFDISILATSKICNFHCLNLKTEQIGEFEFHLNDIDGWSKVRAYFLSIESEPSP